MNLYDYVKEQFNNGNFIGKSKKYVFSFLNANERFEKKSVEKILRKIEDEGEYLFYDGKFQTARSAGLIKGTIKGNERGFAFLLVEGGELPDLFIPNKYLNGAEHKDLVLAVKTAEKTGNSDEAKVVKIIKRGITFLCGTYYKEKNFGFVRPDDKNYFDDIFVKFSNSNGAESGDKVGVELISFPTDDNPEGKINAVFGRQFDFFAEENSILYNYGYKDRFPDKVLKEVSTISDEISENQLIGRLNFENEIIVTIDGEHSRDFDDAVNVKRSENGNFILGVHIADVSEYVKYGSNVEKEAYNRSTSVYFPDRVIPMLPEKLSNGVCSLNEGVTRLTLSCVMEIDHSGEIVDRKICKSYIKSKKRLTYSQVQSMIDGDEETISRFNDLYPMIKDMYALSEILSLKREKRGCINLEVKEAEIYLEGDDIVVSQRKADKAYKIIEEFMLEANECVADFAFYTDIPFIYRIHEKPSPEKATSFINFLKSLGINVKWKAEKCYPNEFSDLLKKIEGTPIFSLVNRVMLRSLQKARYSPDNVGHFGLSSKRYCHFTSPIRRYPDLVVHRIIKMILDGRIGELSEFYSERISEAANISSENERKADEAERAVDDLYKVKYMEKFVGEEFDGIISGVTSFGIFTELDNTIEGFTPIENLPRGKYFFDENNFTLSSGKYTFKLGERIRIGVLSANISTKRVEFIILGKI
ncbi:MAG: ribonuclease R [Clostridia bacterium]|nr:ribonuclease R [Clostridia bacterium]